MGLKEVMNRERLGFIKSSILAGAVALGGHGAVSAQGEVSNDQCSLPSVNTEIVVTKEKAVPPKYKLPLDAIPDFIDLSANKSIADLYAQAAKNPADYIEILDPLFAETYNFYNGDTFVYLVYGRSADETSDPLDWSIQIAAEEGDEQTSLVSVGVKLEEGFEVFDNCTMNESYFNFDVINLGSHANEIFNIPEEMKTINWNHKINYQNGIDWFERRYRLDPYDEKTEFMQTLQQNNVIYFKAPYPLPVDPPNIPISDYVSAYQEENNR